MYTLQFGKGSGGQFTYKLNIGNLRGTLMYLDSGYYRGTGAVLDPWMWRLFALYYTV